MKRIAELNQTIDAYANALDDMARLFRAKTGEDIDSLIDYSQKHVCDNTSKVLIATALSIPPTHVVDKFFEGVEWKH